MKIWIIRDMEPLPTDSDGRRLMRAGMLATMLASLGHETTWFTSTFDHYQKRQRANHDQRIEVTEGLTVHAFHAPGYRRNISLRRIMHNRSFARSFSAHAEAAGDDLPDILVTDIPTTEAASATIAFARKRDLPTILSIRDLWPDFFVDFLPAALRPAARIAIRPLDAQAAFACRHADSLIGISEGYLEWGRRKGARAHSPQDRIFPLGYRPEPLPDEAESNEILTKLGADAGKKLVAFVGSWGKTYDLELVLETARALAHRNDLQFVIAGDSRSRPELRRGFEALPNVVLTDWISAREIAVLLSNSVIGLLPYAENAPQGLPNKLFEYMAYGTYQLATLGGETEAFYAHTEAGRALPGASAVQFAAAIVGNADDVSLMDRRDRRIASFRKEFAADKIYREMIGHIVEIAETHKRQKLTMGASGLLEKDFAGKKKT